tara:strand:- start:767 stop:1189 length:423 start_codon:yes stop_codon:yes gene_type:complete
MKNDNFILTYQNKVIFEGRKEQCFVKLLNVQPNSCYYALTSDDYKITLKSELCKKVEITERRVYHKVAKITMEIPHDIPLQDTAEWLWGNDAWEQVLDDKFETAELEYGTGLDEVPNMNEIEADRETRYDVIKENYGGHL